MPSRSCSVPPLMDLRKSLSRHPSYAGARQTSSAKVPGLVCLLQKRGPATRAEPDIVPGAARAWSAVKLSTSLTLRIRRHTMIPTFGSKLDEPTSRGSWPPNGEVHVHDSKTVYVFCFAHHRQF